MGADRGGHGGTHGQAEGVRGMTLPWWFPGARRRRERELAEEMRAHLRMAEADHMARGESPARAAAGARREIGNLGQIPEGTRAAGGGPWVARAGPGHPLR